MYSVNLVNSIGRTEEVLYFMIRMEYYYLRHSMTIKEMEQAENTIVDKDISLEDYTHLISNGELLEVLIELEKEVNNIRFVKELQGDY